MLFCSQLRGESRYIEDSAVMIDSVIVTNSTCDLQNGTITIFASGSFNIRYSIDGGITFQDENIFTDLDNDDYLILVIAESCSDVTSVTILNDGFPPAPVLNCPPSIEIDCAIDPLITLTSQIENITASNFNNEPIPAVPTTPLSDLNFFQCDPPQEIELMSVDTCMGTTFCSVNIIFLDTIAPVLVCPQALDVFIGDPFHLDAVGDWEESLTGLDSCGGDINFSSDLDDTRINFQCDSFFIIVVEFEGIDVCGNRSTCNSQLNVTNELEPVVVCNANFNIECNADTEDVLDFFLEQFEDISSFDEDVTVEPGSNIDDIIGLLCGEIVTVEYSVKDGCERLTNCSSELTIEDFIPPSQEDCPDNLIVEEIEASTRDDVMAWLNAHPFALDNCSDVDQTADFDTLLLDNLCAFPDTMTVNFVAADRCGNSTSCESLLFIQSQSVQLTCQDELTIECGDPNNDQLIADWLMTVEATDQDGLMLPVTDNFTGTQSVVCTDSITVLFTAVNNCGLPFECASIIRIEDTTNPEITCPDDQNFILSEGNIEERIDAWLAEAVGTDLCSVVEVSTSFDSDIGSLSCNLDTLVEFMAIDSCGLMSTCSAALSLSNDLSVQITCPQDTSVLCAARDGENFINRIIATGRVVTSNSQVELFNDFEEIDFTDCSTSRIITVDLSAIDECNNSDFCTFEVVLVPEPLIYLPNIVDANAVDEVNRSFGVFGNDGIRWINDVLIYDRYGKLVARTMDSVNSNEVTVWDGTINGELAEQGVYTYRLRYTTISDDLIITSGNFTLIR